MKFSVPFALSNLAAAGPWCTMLFMGTLQAGVSWWVWMTCGLKTHHKTHTMEKSPNNRGVSGFCGLRVSGNVHKIPVPASLPVHILCWVTLKPRHSAMWNISKENVLSGRKCLVSLLVCFESFLKEFSKATSLQNKQS